MKTRKLGMLEVAEIGFGTMSFAGTYDEARDRPEAIRVIRGAHELGVTLFDTAEAYGPFDNEELVGDARAPVRNEVVIAHWPASAGPVSTAAPTTTAAFA